MEFNVEDIIEAYREYEQEQREKEERKIREFFTKRPPPAEIEPYPNPGSKKVKRSTYYQNIESQLQSSKKETQPTISKSETPNEKLRLNSDQIKLAIAMINQREKIFEEMQETLTKKRTHPYKEKHTMMQKLKALTLMKLMDISSCSTFAGWIKSNEKLFNELNFGEIPEKATVLTSLFYGFDSSRINIIRNDFTEVVAEIANELKKSDIGQKAAEEKGKQAEKKENPKPEKSEPQKESTISAVIVPFIPQKESDAILIISKIKEHENQFQQLVDIIHKKRFHHRDIGYPVIMKLESFAIAEICGYRDDGRLADWIIQFQELLIEKLGFVKLTGKTRKNIHMMLKASRRSLKDYLPEGEIKKIAVEIKNETAFKKEGQKVQEKQEEKKEEPKPKKPEPIEKEQKPTCFHCGTDEYLKKDPENPHKFLCTQCKRSFYPAAPKRQDISQKINQSIGPKENSNGSALLTEEMKMKNRAWSLYNLHGEKNPENIVKEINTIFHSYKIAKDIAQYIAEKKKERQGLKCGEMDCFKTNGNCPVGTCKRLIKIRGRDEDICDQKLEELKANQDSRLKPIISTPLN